jgi:hypothetical protein
VGKLIGGYAGARVGDRDRQVIASPFHADRNGASLGGEFDRIAEQVREHTEDPLGVSVQAWRINEIPPQA